MTEHSKTIRLVTPGGFCAGVRGALAAFEKTRKDFSGNIYVLHELVHNRRVGENMRSQGAVFVDDLSEIPPGSVVLFGAHGVGKREEQEALKRNLKIVDACCPRVKRLHKAAAALKKEEELILFGNPAHPEVRGVAGHAGTEKVFILPGVKEIAALPELNAPTLLCQTTRDHLEIETFTTCLKQRFPHLKVSEGVCDAVFRRQQAVEKMIPEVDVMIIVGSPHSSNANRMRDVAQRLGKDAYLIDSVCELPDLTPYRHIGLGAGASTPDQAVQEVLEHLLTLGYQKLDQAVPPPEKSHKAE